MGYNTTLLLLNDAMYEIDKNVVGWWEETKLHMSRFHDASFENDYGFGTHASGFEIAQIAHADVTSLIAVGGNYSTILLAEMGLGSQDTEEGQVKILKAFARKLGYKVSKLSSRENEKRRTS